MINRNFAMTSVILIIFGVLGVSWHSSAKIAARSNIYKFQETPTPTPTPTPSPSPSPSATSTPVPEPEPVRSPTPTPSYRLSILKQEMR